jgi:hypothetical protein
MYDEKVDVLVLEVERHIQRGRETLDKCDFSYGRELREQQQMASQGVMDMNDLLQHDGP